METLNKLGWYLEISPEIFLGQEWRIRWNSKGFREAWVEIRSVWILQWEGRCFHVQVRDM